MIHSPIKIAYSLDVIQDEVRHLVHEGILSRQQPIYTLCQFIPPLLRDRIADLIGSEDWDND